MAASKAPGITCPLTSPSVDCGTLSTTCSPLPGVDGRGYGTSFCARPLLSQVPNDGPAGESPAQCDQLLRDIEREKKTIANLEKMIVDWHPGIRASDYGLGIDATPDGYRGGQYKNSSKGYQGAVDALEADAMANFYSRSRNAILGGVGFYTLGLHGAIHDTTAAKQLAQTILSTERYRSMYVLERMEKIYADKCGGKN